ncbi:hypothetical protein GRI32_04430 [Altererythrobacter aestuarii]|uniref:Uncharacterized protein n=2 Tax=Alteraurantiacibacter aestuarii TaxID=650004 RepID=A0A844ZKE3_9SPHN|nr:hypothetical protein [Alteraurantiacibacter aestuarii]MXO87983.1 hypothetical protein [Alteraurantiacibacter aestuarii]
MEEGYSYPRQTAQSRRLSTRAIVLAVLAAFLLGVLATFIMTRGDGMTLGELFRLRSDDQQIVVDPALLGASPTPTSSEPAEEVVQEARAAVERVQQVEVQTGGIDQRVAAMEQRLTRLDLQSQAAAGNAARAEGLLIAFAARRAIERGQPLGYLEDQLRLRFGDARPNAVQTVIDAAANPVTLEQLVARLDGIAPDLVDVPDDMGLLSRIGHELSQLFVIRTDDTPSPVAENRLERARTNLESGRIEFAITEIRNMPNAALAERWIADAELYAAAQRALEALETAAILEPRDLRDASGDRVAQPSPAN